MSRKYEFTGETMNDNETITDLIAWLRRPREGENAYLTAWRNEIADRLEAAHRRERGDEAKLREAVKAAYDKLLLMALGVMNKLDAALAAPPRNCDLARDWMRDLYAHFQPPASVKREMPPEWVDAVMAFCRWLVAPATEQEGGNK